MLKAQSALEYLFVFGIAFIIILLVGGALFYLGIFNPDQSTATVVSELSYFHVSDALLGSDGSFSLNLGVKTGETTQVKNINYEVQGYSCSNTLDEGDFSVSPDGSILVSLSADTGCGLEAGAVVTMDVTIVYTKSSALEHTDSGRIRLLVQPYFISPGNYVWFTGNQSAFDEGEYANTTFGSVILFGTNSSGTYTSRVFDVGATASWTSIIWSENLSYGEEMSHNEGNILLYHFNNDSDYGENNTRIYDFSGEGNNGTAVNGTLPVSSGKFNGAFNFDGTNDAVIVGNLTALTGTNVTITAWVYYGGGTGSYDPILTQSDGSYIGYYFYVYGGDDKLAFWLDDNEATSLNPLPVNEWVFVAGTHNQTHLQVYINGQFEGIAAKSGSGLGKTGYVGFDDAGEYFGGRIDEVAVWNRTLSLQEILNIYKAGALRLNATVRSCDDNACSGESWSSEYENSTVLSVPDNQYFQYKFNFYTEDANYSPVLYNVTVNYEIS